MNRVQLVAANAGRLIKQNSPALLTAAAVAGVATTVFLSVRATFKAADRIWESEFQAVQVADVVELRSRNELTPVEKFKLIAPLYVPAAAVGGVTVMAIIMANTISSRRTAALMSVYTLTETAFREYQDKVIETAGERKEKAIVDAIAQDHIDADPPTKKDMVLIDNNVLVRDDWSQRYFHSTIEKIRSVQNDLNEALISGDGFVSLNDFYMGLSLAPSVGGELVGWSAENKVNISYSTGFAGDDQEGVPCLVIGFRAKPMQDYDRHH